MNKSALRQQMKTRRQKISLAIQREAAALLAQRTRHLKEFIHSKRIALYWAFQNEIDPNGILHLAHLEKKSIYLPVLDEQHQALHFAKYQPGDKLIKNRFGVLEPLPIHLIAAEQLDLVFTPLLAFDRHGNRLGSGQGYYDRTFAFSKQAKKKRPHFIGLAYDWQEVSQLEPDTWDVKLDKVITP